MDKNSTMKESTQEIKDRYVGAEIDTADDNKVSAEMIKEETAMLNDNPRNQAIVDD